MINKLKQKIHSLCPDLLKLEFGTEIKFIGKTWFFAGYGRNDGGTTLMLTDGIHADGKQSYTTANAEKMDSYEILGKPITLLVILRAIISEDPYKRQLVKGFISGDRITSFEENILNALSRWNLSRDSLDSQTPETISFLADLLEVNT